MKIGKISYSILVLFLLQSTMAFSQLSDKNWDLMLVREDKVYPSRTDNYEMTLMDLKEFLSNKEVSSFNYFTHLQANYYYTHITPINKLSDLSKGIHSFMAEEVNDPQLDLIMDYLNDDIESYRYYILQYLPAFSYIPEGDDWGTGSPYRKWSYYYFQPGSEKEVEAVLSAWKQLYKGKGVKTGYRVFKGFIGIQQPSYILTTWAQDPLDYQENMMKTMALLGEDGLVLWSKMMEFVSEAESVEGWFLPSYSFAPGGLQLAK